MRVLRSGQKVAALLIVGLGAGAVEELEGCTPSTQGQVVQTVPVAVNLVECIYQQVDQCIVAKTPWAACTVQVATTCGTDAATVVSIWASKKAAEAREGDAGAGYPSASERGPALIFRTEPGH